MTEYWVLTHLGLGDHIICKPIISHLLGLHDKINIFAKSVNETSIRVLYKDSPRVNIIRVAGDMEAGRIISNIPSPLKLILGHENLNKNVSFDLSFYNQVGLPIENKWNNFMLTRDREDEQSVYDKVVKNPNYIVCHTNTIRGVPSLKIAEEKDHQIIHIDQSYDGSSGIFSWLGVIERSKGVVVTNSCYMNLINQLDVCSGRRYYYRGTHYIPHEQVILREGWKIL